MLKLLTPRINLFFIGVFLKLGFSTLTGGPYVVSPSKSVLGIISWILWFGVLWLVALPKTDLILSRWNNHLKKVTVAIVLLLSFAGISIAGIYVGLKTNLLNPDSFNEPIKSGLAYFKTQPRYSDGAALTQQATENFIDGKNPYASSNIITAMETYDGQASDNNGPFVNLTPIQEGRFSEVFPYPSQEALTSLWEQSKVNPTSIPIELESRLSYPAGSFLISVPFMLAGLDNMQLVVGLFLLAAIVFGLWRIPGKSRLIFAIAAAVSLELWITGLIGLEKRLVIFPFMVAGWLLIPRYPKLSMLLLGAGAAAYQTVWFLVPFAAIYVYHVWGWKRAAAGVALAAAVFAALNLPFIVADPVLWFRSVMAPVFDPLYPLGVGLVSLTETGIVNIESSAVFTLLELAALGGGLWWYYKNGPKYPSTGLLLAILPVFFAWRSLNSYFFYFDIILLAAVLIEYHSRDLSRPAAIKVIT
ncbi:hypothetical protein Dform_00565 [Dehalogenimonas formicexedens]|uniref:DUF2029 domain-containing protein n=1 Tax=Dehalogenimonas formicexedens TaxID=1839801 RepID=A0A1P8F655_9CHLR|nr:hypothetical protein [Dehalogenimonas formicexedens]APV43920.1 hypothetical protein Dform_00565 [Dehalogenimonas formicexedens]